jgi:hypothetical protein
LEAWFWSDQGVIDIVGPGANGKAERHPHNIRQPKEALKHLSWRAHLKPVYSTNMNEKLAEKLDLDLCAQRCPSFAALRDFAIRIFGSA